MSWATSQRAKQATTTIIVRQIIIIIFYLSNDVLSRTSSLTETKNRKQNTNIFFFVICEYSLDLIGRTPTDQYLKKKAGN